MDSVYGFPVGAHLTIEQIRAVQIAQEQAKLPAKPKPKPQGEEK